MSGDTTLVSVILPTHRRPHLLHRSIASVLGQTYSNLELIVVDDASPDHTGDVVRSFTDPRLRYVRREQNGRAARARNDGIALARGEFVAFQDDDDIWMPNKLELQVPALRDAPAEVGLVLCSYIRWLKWHVTYIGLPIHSRNLDLGRGDVRNVDYSMIATPAWLVRRELLERVGGFDPRLRSWDDWELGLRLWQACRFRHLDVPLFIQDQCNGGAMMRDHQAFGNDMRVILEKHGPLWDSRPRVQARHCYVVGRGDCEYGSVADARTWLRRALRLNPFQLRAWVVLGVSCTGAGGARQAFRAARAAERGWQLLRRAARRVTRGLLRRALGNARW